jgi:hypothetical protein
MNSDHTMMLGAFVCCNGVLASNYSGVITAQLEERTEGTENTNERSERCDHNHPAKHCTGPNSSRQKLSSCNPKERREPRRGECRHNAEQRSAPATACPYRENRDAGVEDGAHEKHARSKQERHRMETHASPQQRLDCELNNDGPDDGSREG